MQARRPAAERPNQVNGARAHSAPHPIIYPESDGRPMGETPVHRDAMIRLIQTLQDRYAGDPDVYVSGDMMMCYEPGNPRAVLSPDVFVTFGISKLPERRVYLTWEEGKVPAIVVEVTSRSTSRRDRRTEPALYAALGVREYILYDPLGEITPALQGYRLIGGAYVLVVPESDGAITSIELGLRLVIENAELRLYDRATGTRLLSPAERADAAERRATTLETRLAEMETRLAELESRLRQGEPPQAG